VVFRLIGGTAHDAVILAFFYALSKMTPYGDWDTKLDRQISHVAFTNGRKSGFRDGYLLWLK
jgi:hypothetical protein